MDRYPNPLHPKCYVYLAIEGRSGSTLGYNRAWGYPEPIPAVISMLASPGSVLTQDMCDKKGPSMGRPPTTDIGMEIFHSEAELDQPMGTIIHHGILSRLNALSRPRQVSN